MEKITAKIAALPPGTPYFSLEFFPPKTTMGSSNLRARLDRMSHSLHPLFVTVTWGAGGSTAERSMELAELCQRELGLTTCLHLTCTNMKRELVDRALEDAKALGVRNLLALRGDPPREDYNNGDGEEEGERDFEWAVDLVRYIRKGYGEYFCIGVAAYPEGHADESHPEGQSLEHDLPYLVEKVRAGVDFIMSQLFFDVDAYAKFERTLREHESGVFKTMPIIPGMMPIQSYQMIRRTTKLSHAKIPTRIMTRLDSVKGDDEMVKKVGVDVVSEIVTQIKKHPSPGPRGFHFYTLNLEKAVSFILERTKLIPCSPTDVECAIQEEPLPLPLQSLNINGSQTNGSRKRFGRRQSSVGSDPHNRIIITAPQTSNPSYEATGLEAGVPAEPVNTRANTLAISEGEGALGREATWDDFPNGRWGDARSPAYGEIDGYGVSLHMSVNQAIKLWGYPASREDITGLFIRHIEGSLSAIPWSEEGLNEETHTIKNQLLNLNRKGWWTVASQPAVNGVRSTDQVFGWGPRNGFVFQKAFVELFIPSEDWKTLQTKLVSSEVAPLVSWYASNASGDFLSSENSSSAANGGEVGSTNAVTWGAFPGKEIITPTIIEEVSFKAWAEEAFVIWGEWERVYGAGEKGGTSRRLIEGVSKDVWLVNVIHHGYIEKEGLWEMLLR
jgi:methylenetetrahydrofolate reductase (NADPH)